MRATTSWLVMPCGLSTSRMPLCHADQANSRAMSRSAHAGPPLRRLARTHEDRGHRRRCPRRNLRRPARPRRARRRGDGARRAPRGDPRGRHPPERGWGDVHATVAAAETLTREPELVLVCTKAQDAEAAIAANAALHRRRARRRRAERARRRRTPRRACCRDRRAWGCSRSSPRTTPSRAWCVSRRLRRAISAVATARPTPMRRVADAALRSRAGRRDRRLPRVRSGRSSSSTC